MNGTDSDIPGWRERWPTNIVRCNTDWAIEVLNEYYAEDFDGLPLYTGARFEVTAARNRDAHSIGVADLVAVSMLSVNVPPRAAIRLLGKDSTAVTALLKQIPTDLEIIDADPSLLDSGAPAEKLWTLLREARDGLGRTTTSKLLAAKRPRLIPIWDGSVETATGLGTQKYWQRTQRILTADGGQMWAWLKQLPPHIENLPTSISELRVLDVLLWMSVERERKAV